MVVIEGDPFSGRILGKANNKIYSCFPRIIRDEIYGKFLWGIEIIFDDNTSQNTFSILKHEKEVNLIALWRGMEAMRHYSVAGACIAVLAYRACQLNYSAGDLYNVKKFREVLGSVFPKIMNQKVSIEIINEMIFRKHLLDIKSFKDELASGTIDWDHRFKNFKIRNPSLKPVLAFLNL